MLRICESCGEEREMMTSDLDEFCQECKDYEDDLELQSLEEQHDERRAQKFAARERRHE